MRPLLAASIAVLVLAGHAVGGETAWQELLPGVEARLVSAGAPDASGRTLIGLEIDLPAGMKTYWRVPGETGLPPRLDLTGSSGIAGHSLHWPFPAVDTSQGYLDFVYTGRVVLPAEVVLSGDTAQIELSALIGICSDVCVPAQADFSLALPADEEPDRANGLRLRQALALVPQDAADAPVLARFDPETGELVLEFGSDVDPASVIVARIDGDAVFGTASASAGRDQLRVPLLGLRDHSESYTLEILYKTPQGAFRHQIEVELS